MGVHAVAVVSDLIFASKIEGTARAMGLQARVVASSESLVPLLAEGSVRLVMVDMTLPLEIAASALRLAAAHQSRPSTLAFYSHVSAAQRDAAIAAGADQVLARSAFSSALPTILRERCAAADA